MANALARLGTKRSWIVHGEDGSDEISISGRTFVAEIKDKNVSSFELVPSDLGIEAASVNGLEIKTPRESAEIIRGVLNGKFKERPAERIVLANAAAAVYLSNGQTDVKAALDRVSEVIREGKAAEKLAVLANAVSS
jgi:anthranilate phosphoribosyltransferase